MHRFLDLVLVSASNRVGNDHVCPQRDADEQIDDQPDDRAVCPNRRHSGRALRGAGEIAGHRPTSEALKSCSRIAVAATGSAKRGSLFQIGPCSRFIPSAHKRKRAGQRASPQDF